MYISLLQYNNTIHLSGAGYFSVVCIKMLNCLKKKNFFHRQWQRTAERHRKTPKGQDGCALDRRRGVWKLVKWSAGLAGSGPRGVWGVHFRDSTRGGERRGERRCASRNFIRLPGEYSERMFGSPNRAVFSALLLSILSVSWYPVTALMSASISGAILDATEFLRLRSSRATVQTASRPH